MSSPSLLLWMSTPQHLRLLPKTYLLSNEFPLAPAVDVDTPASPPSPENIPPVK
uniref:Uncharacterized protein n=1 Tax=Physcomitrium patens TaxID=3218 RepID=A0A2K1IM53_PHYPA|nr:hypothetical protein PHYPA_026670 [Physcomitrium patens]PNR30355.1 hypothetical protein PHYPA_026671 [Physcomitrium patens]